MKLKVIIDKLKADAPSLGGRVSGFSDFIAVAEREDSLAAPHAFVVRLNADVEPSSTAGIVAQTIEERFGVLVCVDASADTRGLDADDRLDDLRSEIKAALVGWSPSPERSPFEDGGFETIAVNRARAWRRFEFTTLLCE